jgi:phage terminase large subunit-like protein
MLWSHTPEAPRQTNAWRDEMQRSLRPNQYLRMIENRWVSAETSFIDLKVYDQCVDADYRPVLTDHQSVAFCAVDASVKHDSTAIVALTYDKQEQRVRLLNHKIFQPTPQRPIDFEAAVERTILNWSRAYLIKSVLFDPYQMASVGQRLYRDGIRMVEFPQTTDRLTAAAENLYELIRSQNIVVYHDEQIRTAISRTVRSRVHAVGG